MKQSTSFLQSSNFQNVISIQRQHLILYTFYPRIQILSSRTTKKNSSISLKSQTFLSRDRSSNIIVSDPPPKLSFLVVLKDVLIEFWLNLHKNTMLAIQYSQMQKYNLQYTVGQHPYLQNRKQNILNLPLIFFSTAPQTPD